MADPTRILDADRPRCILHWDSCLCSATGCPAKKSVAQLILWHIVSAQWEGCRLGALLQLAACSLWRAIRMMPWRTHWCKEQGSSKGLFHKGTNSGHPLSEGSRSSYIKNLKTLKKNTDTRPIYGVTHGHHFPKVLPPNMVTSVKVST